MDRARTLAGRLATLSGRSLGSVDSVNLKSLNTSWAGLGADVEVTASLSVTFTLN